MTKTMRILALCVAVILALATIGVNATNEANDAVSPLFAPRLVSDVSDLTSLLSTSESDSSSSSSSSVARTCPTESLRRIALCEKVVRTFLAPDPNPTKPQIVPHSSKWSSSKICKKLMKVFPYTVLYESCQQLAGHILGAAKSTAVIVSMSRKMDIHDACLVMLHTPFQGANARLIQTADVASCTLKSTGGITGTRVLMLHGMGGANLQFRSWARAQPFDKWLGAYPKYWSVQDQLDGIADVRYYVTDTTMRGWGAKSLQKEYCDAIIKFNPHVIFTHSMGNNIIAAAIANNIPGCADRLSKKAGPGKTMWFSSQAPWHGSPAAAASTKACGGGAVGFWNRVKQAVVKAAGSCSKAPATQSMVPTFRNMVSQIQLGGMKAIAQDRVSGALCGISAAPLSVGDAFTSEGAGLFLLSEFGESSTLIDWGVDADSSTSRPYSGNDGLVPFHSCALPGARYGTKPTSPFYAGKLSHQDGTCFSPDKLSRGLMKLPCTWFVQRTLDARVSFKITGSSADNVLKVNPFRLPAFQSSYPQSFLQIEDAMPLKQRQALDEKADADEADKEAKDEDQIQIEMEMEMEKDDANDEEEEDQEE